MSLSDLSLRRPTATLMVLLSLTVLGLVAVFRLPIGFFPMIESPLIVVTVPFPGSHPLETLRQVMEPLEDEVATVADMKEFLTYAEAGQGNVFVFFDRGVDVDMKKMEIREAVERARDRLPDTIGHITIEGALDGPNNGAILEGRIAAERDLTESWDLLDRHIGQPLERIKGVAKVDLYGVKPQEVRIDLDLEALRRHGVNAADVLRLVNATNRDVDAGVIRDGMARYDVRTETRFRSAAEIAELRLGAGDLRVRDVAEVELREPRLEYARHLDRSAAIGISVYKEPTANTVATVDKVMQRIAEIEQDPQLEGIRLLIWKNSGDEIRSALSGLRNAGIYGGLLAVIVLHLFLRRWRTTAVVAFAIPFSLLVTCGAMYLLDAEFNSLTLLGLMLGVGMLVDNAVVVIENIYRLESTGMEPGEAARVGAREVSLAVVASTATTVCVWAWLFVIERDTMATILGAVALTICLSVVCSLLISLTFIPLAAARFAPRRAVEDDFMTRRVVPAYRRLLGWTLEHRFLTLAGLFLLASSTALPVIMIEKSGDFAEQERDVMVRYRVHDPSTKPVLKGYVDRIEDWLYEHEEELGFETVYSYYREPDYASTRVYLPEDKASPARLTDLQRRLRQGLPVIAGVELEVGDRQNWRRRNQDRRMVSVELHGEDPEFLEELALEVEHRVKSVEGVQEVWGPTLEGQQELRIAIRAEQAHNLQVKPHMIAEAVSFVFRGRRMRRLQDAQGEVEMIIGLSEEARPGVAALADLAIPTNAGTTVPLSAVADVRMARTPERIRRQDREGTIQVTLQFDKEEVTTSEAKDRIREALVGFETPEGYSWDFGRWGRDRDEALATMILGVNLSLLVVIMLMAALFESLSDPFAIIITLLLAFFGAFWSLWLFGFQLDPVAFTGVIILIGIVVNNGIVMVHHVNGLRRSGQGRREALLQGCGERLRPVVMTAITTIAGLVPLAFSGMTVAKVGVASTAVAVVGGLTTSTLFTLVALPVWYTALEDLLAWCVRLLPRRDPGRAQGPDRTARGVLTNLETIAAAETE